MSVCVFVCKLKYIFLKESTHRFFSFYRSRFKDNRMANRKKTNTNSYLMFCRSKMCTLKDAGRKQRL